MPKPIKDLNDFFIFTKVVEHGNYSAAARALGLQVSGVSRRISDLEQELGVRLLNRTTRQVSLSSVGEEFHRHCLSLLAEAQAARDSVDKAGSAPRGVVRLSCPVALLRSHVARILSRYLRDNPDVSLEVDATNRRVDVVEEGVDIAIRVRIPPLDDSELLVRTLGPSEFIVLGSRGFFAQHGLPTSAGDLSRLPSLAMARASSSHTWTFRDSTGDTVTVRHKPRLVTDDMHTLIQAAVDGVGVALLPRSMVLVELAAGLLEQVLPDVKLPEGVIHAVFPSRRGQVPAVRGLLDALVAGFDPAASN